MKTLSIEIDDEVFSFIKDHFNEAVSFENISPSDFQILLKAIDFGLMTWNQNEDTYSISRLAKVIILNEEE